MIGVAQPQLPRHRSRGMMFGAETQGVFCDAHLPYYVSNSHQNNGTGCAYERQSAVIAGGNLGFVRIDKDPRVSSRTAATVA